jgi:hypothetical protein
MVWKLLGASIFRRLILRVRFVLLSPNHLQPRILTSCRFILASSISVARVPDILAAVLFRVQTRPVKCACFVAPKWPEKPQSGRLGRTCAIAHVLLEYALSSLFFLNIL